MHHLILLHGAIGSSQQLQPLQEKLQDHYHVHLLDFPGHGGSDMPAEFSIPLFASYVKDYINTHKILTAAVFGYSMGGYVALYLARHYPALIDHVITLATKFEWNAAVAEKEVKMLQPAVIEAKLPAFAATLQARHAPQRWEQVLEYTAAMLLQMGSNTPLAAEEMAAIQTPCLLMVGDRDKMVTLDETVQVYQHLAAARLCVLPATPHHIEQADMDMLAYIIRRFVGTYYK